MPDLYDAVGHGMWAYSNAAFRVEVLGGEKPDPGPGTLVAVTHRKETDVPVIGAPLYFAMGGRRNTTGPVGSAREASRSSADWLRNGLSRSTLTLVAGVGASCTSLRLST